MIDLLHGDLIRYLIAAEMAALIGLAVFMHVVYDNLTPAPVVSMDRSLLWVVASVALAVLINAAVGPELTPGSYAVALVAIPALARGVRLTRAAIRDR